MESPIHERGGAVFVPYDYSHGTYLPKREHSDFFAHRNGGTISDRNEGLCAPEELRPMHLSQEAEAKLVIALDAAAVLSNVIVDV